MSLKGIEQHNKNDSKIKDRETGKIDGEVLISVFQETLQEDKRMIKTSQTSLQGKK